MLAMKSFGVLIHVVHMHSIKVSFDYDNNTDKAMVVVSTQDEECITCLLTHLAPSFSMIFSGTECILEWLVKMQPATPCPCCRQEFTDLETIRKEKKIKWSGIAFNPSAVTF